MFDDRDVAIQLRRLILHFFLMGAKGQMEMDSLRMSFIFIVYMI